MKHEVGQLELPAVKRYPSEVIETIGREVVGDIFEFSTEGEMLKGSVTIRLSQEEHEIFKALSVKDDRPFSNAVYRLVSVCYEEIEESLSDEQVIFAGRVDSGRKPPLLERPEQTKGHSIWLKQPGYNRMKFCSWYLGYQNDTAFVENLVRSTIQKAQDKNLS